MINDRETIKNNIYKKRAIAHKDQVLQFRDCTWSFFYNPSKEIYVHPDVIDYYKSNIQQIALYYKLKYTYHNSTIYNWTYKKISHKLSYSYYLTRKNIKWLISEGFAYKHKNNLVLLSTEKLNKNILTHYSKKRYKLLIIKHKYTVKNVENELRFLLLTRKVSHQRYLYSVKADIIKLKDGSLKVNTKKAKKLLRLETDLDCSEKPSSKVYFGMRKLSEFLGTSHTETSRILKRWVKEKRIKTTLVKENLGEFARYMDPCKIQDDEPGFLMCTKNGLERLFGTQIYLTNLVYL